jgi:putative transposase
MRFAFLADHVGTVPLRRSCAALRVSVSGFRSAVHRQPSRRSVEDQRLTTIIQVVHAESRKTYGSPRIHAELRARGERLGRKRVARLMRSAGLCRTPTRRFVTTTDSDHDLPIADNVLQQDFTATAPNQRWVTDITYVATDEGWLFVAGIIDLFARRLVGWSMQPRMDTTLVLNALSMAVSSRRPPPGLIHHSDRGSQYASQLYRQALANHGFVPSMSRRACCYDNAAMESFWHTLKVELIYRRHFHTRDEARQAIFEYIEVFYNQIRRHSSIGYVSPMAFEQRHTAVA